MSITNNQAETLPTARIMQVMGLHTLRNAVSSLTGINLVRKDLNQALNPLIAQLNNVDRVLTSDIETLETEYLAKEADCLEYSTKIVELEAQRVAFEEMFQARMAVANEDLLRVEEQLEQKNQGYAEVVKLKNRAEISCEEKDEEIKRLHDILTIRNGTIHGLQQQIEQLQNSNRTHFNQRQETLRWFTGLSSWLRTKRMRLPKHLSDYT